MPISLRSVSIPDFGVPAEMPVIPAEIYEARVRTAFETAGCDWLVVYADREHLANIAFLTGFEPRFEEALLVLGKDNRRALVVGNESISYAALAALPDLELFLCQTLSLLGQDRSSKPNLEAVLRDIGLAKGDSIGLIGWKYLSSEEWAGSYPTFQASALVADTLRRIAGSNEAVSDATAVLMHPETGLRAVVDVHQIAAGEWGAARASAAVWRIVTGARPGETEYQAASRMGYEGEELSAHLMFASSPKGTPVVGLRSPRARTLVKGDGVTTAVSYWGGLSSRAGLLAEEDDAFLSVAKAYFEGLIAWYETVDIGVAGGVVHDAVVAQLAKGNLKSALNPGHLVGHDEWISTPFRPNSDEKIASGMPFQVDIIPVPQPDGWALNNEDAATIADAALRSELKRLYPEVHARIEARRAFMKDVLGVDLKESILPLSNTPLCLPPFWLTADRLLVRD
ncbi:Xaa-Pro aminopeptidase [uncultured Cohaesibacter sp.]|uniref:Xaa-Pro aminopeptidase n=1 Tax=uncultured Cohaesibacter sp. TaxID=1002546 RepID=UPI00292D118E|nr:Xaa-Pro aminopeptidase [uncultured Cohaesibacter sp.]